MQSASNLKLSVLIKCNQSDKICHYVREILNLSLSIESQLMYWTKYGNVTKLDCTYILLIHQTKITS